MFDHREIMSVISSCFSSNNVGIVSWVVPAVGTACTRISNYVPSVRPIQHQSLTTMFIITLVQSLAQSGVKKVSDLCLCCYPFLSSFMKTKFLWISAVLTRSSYEDKAFTYTALFGWVHAQILRCRLQLYTIKCSNSASEFLIKTSFSCKIYSRTKIKNTPCEEYFLPVLDLKEYKVVSFRNGDK